MSSTWGKYRNQNICSVCLYLLAQWVSRYDCMPGTSASASPRNLLENAHSGALSQTWWIKTSRHGVQGSVWASPPGDWRDAHVWEPLLWSDPPDSPWECYLESVSAAAKLNTTQWSLNVWLINCPSSSTCARRAGPGVRRLGFQSVLTTN